MSDFGDSDSGGDFTSESLPSEAPIIEIEAEAIDAIPVETPSLLPMDEIPAGLENENPVPEEAPPLTPADDQPSDDSPYPPHDWGLPLEESDTLAAHTEAQIDSAEDQLSDNVESFQPEQWSTMSLDQRVEALQNVENEMSVIQGREPVTIHAEEMDPGTSGYFDGKTIGINAADLAGDAISARDHFDTVIHEGRHAYQHQLQENGAEQGLGAVGGLFQANFENYIESESDPESYRNQPVEADAWRFADRLTDRLFGEKEN